MKTEKQRKHLEKVILLKRQRGYWHSSNTIKKIGLGNKGHLAWNKGKRGLQKCSEKRRQEMRELYRRENNPAWKGGIVSLTKIIRHCFKYRQWHSDIFFRDDFTCVLCGQRGGALEVDHYPKMFSVIFHENKIKSLEDAESCEDFWNINNGRTLCKGCHRKTYTNDK